MDGDGTNVIRMGFKLSDLFTGAEVVDTDLEVIRANNDPILTGNKLTCTTWNFTNINGFDLSTGFKIPDLNIT
ncbi:hypothetical protein WICPIJ_007120 [Wickerhamomyces pijperi]|uniref:Uncharacterized protein n=1 Tax=Wickerhamomyces pijperi TaxID=599730 RepID=A0A9P8Q310_WICPI|nr:hypothetical protein WICPIJ_007120 [Wickerhamomyces pijperi]